jgi:hypothetical protein
MRLKCLSILLFKWLIENFEMPLKSYSKIYRVFSNDYSFIFCFQLYSRNKHSLKYLFRSLILQRTSGRAIIYIQFYWVHLITCFLINYNLSERTRVSLIIGFRRAHPNEIACKLSAYI